MEDFIRAGAPALPAGMFYRVRDTVIASLKVEIRARRRVGSRLVADAFVQHEAHATAIDAVVSACARAHKRMLGRDERRARYLATTAYLGDHVAKEES